MTRRCYVQIDGELVEAGDIDNARPHTPVVGDRHYDGLQASDGANISTRAKHREYMRRHGLTTVDDYAGEFQRAGESRERFWRDGYDPTRRPAIERALQRVLEGGKR